jgi:hypothetical protein
MHEGVRSISITDEADHRFCLTLEDAGNRLRLLKEAITDGIYPISIELVNSCPRLITGSAVKYRVTEHDAKKFFHSLEKALSH